MSQRKWEGDYLFLFQNLILKDFRVRYRNMSLGILWSLINPIVMMTVFSFVFGGGVFGHEPVPHYPLVVLCGLVPYNFFAIGFMNGTTSVVENSGLVKRVPVPREILPVTAVLSNLVHIGIQFALLIGMTLFDRYPVNIYWIWLIPIWLLYIVFVIGLSLGSSAVNVFVRDTRYVVESFNLVLMYLVPIFYSFDIIKPKFREVYRINPVAAVVMATRNILIDGKAPPMSILFNMVIAASVTMGIGIIIFRRLKSRFYEHI